MSTLRKLSLASLLLTLSLATCLSFSQTVSNVYVGTTQGVYLYHADPNGTLTLVSGSPFPIAGTATGSNGSYFLSQGTNYVHSYPVASNGAIKGQVSQINTHLYTGNECGTAQGAVLDHTGHVIYSQLYSNEPVSNDEEACAALQSFNISNTGALSFLGATEFNTETQSGLNTASSTLIALSGTGSYAYSAAYDHGCNVATWEFSSESNGTMISNPQQQYLTVPNTPFGWRWMPFVMTADPTNHFAIAMGAQSGSFGPCGDVAHLTRLASFTIGTDGNLATTNTFGSLITPRVDPLVLNMSPSGQFLAIGGAAPNPDSYGNTQTPGLEVFHFNGANPITSYSGVLTTAPINEIHWDSNGHMYAVSNSTKKIYVYTVTSSRISAAPGSPFTIPATPNALVVVPTAPCSAPSTPGVHICAPANGSTVGSPVQVKAAATVTGAISNMQLWVDGVKKYTASGSKSLNTFVSVSAGTHRFAVLAINTLGQKWESVSNATVK